MNVFVGCRDEVTMDSLQREFTSLSVGFDSNWREIILSGIGFEEVVIAINEVCSEKTSLFLERGVKSTRIFTDLRTAQQIYTAVLNFSTQPKPIHQNLSQSATRPWWEVRRTELLSLVDTKSATAKSTPLYVYNLALIEEKANELLQLQVFDQIFYAVKANSHPAILQLLYQKGFGFECVSPGEIEHVIKLFPDINRGERILFTPNFAPKEEYEKGFALGTIVTLDNLYPLEHWPEVFKNRSVYVRIDPEKGRGHHKHVRTAGTKSKFGIPISTVDKLVALCRQYNVKVVGLHAHTGSGILKETENWVEVARLLFSLIPKFPDVRVLNLGGGLGVPYQPQQPPLNLCEVSKTLKEFKSQIVSTNPNLILMIEPGRYLVAEAGVLLCRMTQLKQKDEMWFLGVDTGFNTLIRPTLYEAYHHIVNLTKLGAPNVWKVDVVGVICESGDVLGRNREFPESETGDVILIATTGAYGRSMSSHYNLRNPADEYILQTNVNKVQ